MATTNHSYYTKLYPDKSIQCVLAWNRIDLGQSNLRSPLGNNHSCRISEFMKEKKMSSD